MDAEKQLALSISVKMDTAESQFRLLKDAALGVQKATADAASGAGGGGESARVAKDTAKATETVTTETERLKINLRELQASHGKIYQWVSRQVRAQKDLVGLEKLSAAAAEKHSKVLAEATRGEIENADLRVRTARTELDQTRRLGSERLRMLGLERSSQEANAKQRESADAAVRARARAMTHDVVVRARKEMASDVKLAQMRKRDHYANVARAQAMTNNIITQAQLEMRSDARVEQARKRHHYAAIGRAQAMTNAVMVRARKEMQADQAMGGQSSMGQRMVGGAMEFGGGVKQGVMGGLRGGLRAYWIGLSMFYGLRNVLEFTTTPLRLVFEGFKRLVPVLIGLSKQLMDTAGQVETLQARLMPFFGGGTAGMTKWIMKQSVGMPFEWSDIGEAVQRGLAMGSPGGGFLKETLMPAVYDLAASFAKKPVEAVMAIMQGTKGRFSRLTRSFGFSPGSALAEGAVPSASGRGVSNAPQDQMQNLMAIIAMINKRVGGTAMNMRDTFGALMSDMADMWKTFAMEFANSGFFAWIKGVGSAIREQFLLFLDHGTRIEDWVKSLSDVLLAPKAIIEDLLPRLPAIVDRALEALKMLSDSLLGAMKLWLGEGEGGVGGLIEALYVRASELGSAFMEWFRIAVGIAETTMKAMLGMAALALDIANLVDGTLSVFFKGLRPGRGERKEQYESGANLAEEIADAIDKSKLTDVLRDLSKTWKQWFDKEAQRGAPGKIASGLLTDVRPVAPPTASVFGEPVDDGDATGSGGATIGGRGGGTGGAPPAANITSWIAGIRAARAQLRGKYGAEFNAVTRGMRSYTVLQQQHAVATQEIVDGTQDLQEAEEDLFALGKKASIADKQAVIDLRETLKGKRLFLSLVERELRMLEKIEKAAGRTADKERRRLGGIADPGMVAATAALRMRRSQLGQKYGADYEAIEGGGVPLRGLQQAHTRALRAQESLTTRLNRAEIDGTKEKVTALKELLRTERERIQLIETQMRLVKAKEREDGRDVKSWASMGPFGRLAMGLGASGKWDAGAVANMLWPGKDNVKRRGRFVKQYSQQQGTDVMGGGLGGAGQPADGRSARQRYTYGKTGEELEALWQKQESGRTRRLAAPGGLPPVGVQHRYLTGPAFNNQPGGPKSRAAVAKRQRDKTQQAIVAADYAARVAAARQLNFDKSQASQAMRNEYLAKEAAKAPLPWDQGGKEIAIGKSFHAQFTASSPFADMLANPPQQSAAQKAYEQQWGAYRTEREQAPARRQRAREEKLAEERRYWADRHERNRPALERAEKWERRLDPVFRVIAPRSMAAGDEGRAVTPLESALDVGGALATVYGGGLARRAIGGVGGRLATKAIPGALRGSRVGTRMGRMTTRAVQTGQYSSRGAPTTTMQVPSRAARAGEAMGRFSEWADNLGIPSADAPGVVHARRLAFPTTQAASAVSRATNAPWATRLGVSGLRGVRNALGAPAKTQVKRVVGGAAIIGGASAIGKVVSNQTERRSANGDIEVTAVNKFTVNTGDEWDKRQALQSEVDGQTLSGGN